MGKGNLTMSGEDASGLKKQAAEHAVSFVKSGMIIGLGEGSTAVFALYKIGELLREGILENIAVFIAGLFD